MQDPRIWPLTGSFQPPCNQEQRSVEQMVTPTRVGATRWRQLSSASDCLLFDRSHGASAACNSGFTLMDPARRGRTLQLWLGTIGSSSPPLTSRHTSTTALVGRLLSGHALRNDAPPRHGASAAALLARLRPSPYHFQAASAERQGPPTRLLRCLLLNQLVSLSQPTTLQISAIL
jgi:hypothetical protein